MLLNILIVDFRAHTARVQSILVIEGLLLEEADDHRLGDETNKSAGRVQDREAIVVRLKGCPARSHVRDARQSDDFINHDIFCLEVLGGLGRVLSQERQLLHAHGTIIK